MFLSLTFPGVLLGMHRGVLMEAFQGTLQEVFPWVLLGMHLGGAHGAFSKERSRRFA